MAGRRQAGGGTSVILARELLPTPLMAARSLADCRRGAERGRRGRRDIAGQEERIGLGLGQQDARQASGGES